MVSVLEIPTEINIPPEDLFSYKIMVYGEKGIGKTSLLAQFPDSLVFMFEPRRRNLAIRQVWEAKGGGALDWSTFKAYVDLLCTKGSEETGIRSVAIDSLDRAYTRCMEHICHQGGIEHPNDANDYGKTWNKIKEEFEGTLVRLDVAGYGVTMTSHAKMDHVVPPLGDAYDQWQPTCSRSAMDVAEVLCDFVLFYGYHGNTRSFTVRGTQAVYAACGIGERFCDSKGRRLLTFDAGTSPEEAYTNLVNAFDNQQEGILWQPPTSILDTWEYKDALAMVETLPTEPKAKAPKKILIKK